MTGTWAGPSGNSIRFGYQEDSSGYHEFGGRLYDPSLGRFLNRESKLDGRNSFALCENNPITSYDGDSLENLSLRSSSRQLQYADACLKKLDACLAKVDKSQNKCLAKAGLGLGAKLRKCRFLVFPKAIAACMALELLIWGVKREACFAKHDAKYDKCGKEFERCKRRQGRSIDSKFSR
jgi:RHS repeat-associated protein